ITGGGEAVELIELERQHATSGHWVGEMLIALPSDVEDGRERKQAAGEGVEEKHVRRAAALRSAPDTNDEEARDQSKFEEHIKEHKVASAEHPEHGAVEQQKECIISFCLVADRVEA